jgi:hypothetical protein
LIQWKFDIAHLVVLLDNKVEFFVPRAAIVWEMMLRPRHRF